MHVDDAWLYIGIASLTCGVAFHAVLNFATEQSPIVLISDSDLFDARPFG